MEGETPSVLLILAFLAFTGTVAVVIVLQILANRHRREGGHAFMLKDSLFRRKELVFTDDGKRYVRTQKLVMVIGSFACVGFVLLDRLAG